MSRLLITPPVLLVNAKMIDLGDVKVPVVKKPTLLSVALAVTPFAQLITPPPEVPFTTPVPLVPYAAVVADVPVVQSVALFTRNPDGNEAVAELPKLSKFCVVGVPKLVMLTCASAPPQQNSVAKTIAGKQQNRLSRPERWWVGSLFIGSYLLSEFVREKTSATDLTSVGTHKKHG